MSRSLISCRTASYEPFESIAFEHVASLGVRHVEIPLPPPEAVDAVEAELVRFGLKPSALHGECDLSRPDVAEQITHQMPVCAAFGTTRLFVSAKAGDTPLETAYDRLRQAGDVAARHGVTIALETHPDLVTDAAVGLRTMQAVNHPHVRINFDTANVYFYNHDVDAVSELRQIISYVASVHLKDTDGGYRHWHFPALGTGVVDFVGVFSVLDEAGFTGPCTLEIEGVEGETKTRALICDRIAESVRFLRGLDRL